MATNNPNCCVQNQTIESLIIKFNIKYKENNYIFSLFDTGNDFLKIIAEKNIDKNCEEIFPNKYGIILHFDELKILHRYFKMFDTFEQAKTDIIELCKSNAIKIIEIKEDELIINMDLKTVNNNLITINLKKIEDNVKEEVSYLKKCCIEQKKEIKELKNIIINLNKRIEKIEEKINNNESNKINSNIINSNIINNNNELMLLFKTISSNPKKLSLKLLYDSEIEGENKEKFKSAYIGKNDIIIFIKTQKNKRFGGYAHEAFQNKVNFSKTDLKAFLFNLDKMKIYKSKGGKLSIWNFEGNSMDFGTGTDLRIFHEFFNKNNYTNQSSNLDYNYDEDYALNGEINFQVKYLEIYKIIFN